MLRVEKFQNNSPHPWELFLSNINQAGYTQDTYNKTRDDEMSFVLEVGVFAE
jgi:hypothetical protein